MLIDSLLPHFDFHERHSILVRAAPERAYDSILSADLTGSGVVRLLLLLRGLGRKPQRTTLRFAKSFSVAAEERPREIVLGIEGPFWKPACRPHGISDFSRPVPPDAARAAWNFLVEREDDTRVRVTTETRILCGENARRRFGLYWIFIRPGSGLIRRMMLRAIRREAER